MIEYGNRGADASPLHFFVCSQKCWFKAKFPDYKKSVVFKDGKLQTASEKKPDVKEYKQKLPNAS